MTTTIKCKRCNRIIVRNARGEWVLPKSKFPSVVCRDGHPHEPDKKPGNDPTGRAVAIGVSVAVVDAGVI